jgi:hypothetical protein
MPASTFARLHNASVAVGNGAELKVEGFESASFQISGTFVATLTFEGSVDWTTLFAVPAYPSDGGAAATTATAPGLWRVNCASFSEVRARISAYTSGSVTVDAMAAQGSVASGGGGGGGGDASEATLSSIESLITAVTDEINGRTRTEINTLHYSEDSIEAQGEEIVAYTEVVTASVATELVVAPGAGNYLVVKAFSYQLLEATDTVAALRDGAAGGDRHVWSLSWSRLSAYGRKISPDGWPLTANTGLYAKLDVAPTAGVRYNIEYVIRAVA